MNGSIVSQQEFLSPRQTRASLPRESGEGKLHESDSSLVCTACGGVGRLRIHAPGDPSFGKSVPCACREAQQTALLLQRRRHTAQLDAFDESTFATFNARFPGGQAAFRVCTEFAAHPVGWLLLLGLCGCGKTHLAAAIANQSLALGAEVFFTTTPDLLDSLRAAISSPERYGHVFARVCEVELLVLDDLGAQQSSAWSNEKLLQLLDTRARTALPTVITAIPKEFQGLDERLRSRLTDAQLVTTVLFEKARDFRPFKPKPGGRIGSW